MEALEAEAGRKHTAGEFWRMMQPVQGVQGKRTSVLSVLSTFEGRQSSPVMSKPVGRWALTLHTSWRRAEGAPTAELQGLKPFFSAASLGPAAVLTP